jgi:hypothetical protein
LSEVNIGKTAEGGSSGPAISLDGLRMVCSSVADDLAKADASPPGAECAALRRDSADLADPVGLGGR